MTSTCPNCGHCWSDAPADPLTLLRQECERRGYNVSFNERVEERIAAELVGRAPGTLRNWASGAQPLTFHLVRNRRMYALTDLARFLSEN